MKTVPLGEVAQFIRGVTFKPADQVASGGLAVMRTKNVQAHLDLRDVVRVRPEILKKKTQLLQEGDTLISSANSWNLVGKCCWIPNLPEPAAIGGFVTALRPDSTVVHPRYLYHWFSSGPVQAQVRSFGNKTTSISNLSVARCEALSFPLPELGEQRRIAAILDQAEVLRAKRRAQLAHLDALPQAIFHEMFGSPLSNAANHPTALLGELATIKTGNSPARSNPANFGPGIEWVKSDNLGALLVTQAQEHLSALGATRARIAPPDSILVTCIAGSRKSIGKCSLADRHLGFNQQINAILPSSKLDPMFILWQFKSAPDLVRDASTGGMKGLVSKSSFGAIRILNPPLPEQQRFSAKASACLGIAQETWQQVAAADELFSSLQSRAFRDGLRS